MNESARSEVYEFKLKALDPGVGPEEVRELLETAVEEAVDAMAREGAEVDARAEIRGAFAGLGETAVLLLVAFLKGAAGAAGAAGGKHFFDTYLKPRLQQRNLAVSDFRERQRASGGE
ncbi:MAG TPA: hypothetical protein VGG03_19820 [Thermoanaerobaculia bacterium]|jgi:hypothetical protein